MKRIIFAMLMVALAGCTAGMYDDNLSSVPVTNNPNLFPISTQTAQGPGF